MPWWRYLLGTAILFVGCGAIYGGLHVCMGVNSGQSRPPHVAPTAHERALIDSIITTMKDMIARIEETVAVAFRDAMQKVKTQNLK